MRRAYNSVLKIPQLSTCPQCAAPYVPHRVCPACGFYKGRQVVSSGRCLVLFVVEARVLEGMSRLCLCASRST
jgi:large subunit ribosomal protein L32